jgi:hypothetical protein
MKTIEFSCYSLEALSKLLVKKQRHGLNINTELAMFHHLDTCNACREAIYYLSREKDDRLFLSCSERA